MTEKQPKALRLAGALDYCEFDVVEHGHQTAAELRRLHAENGRLRLDAERYQSLRADCVDQAGATLEQFDATIDAEMRGMK